MGEWLKPAVLKTVSGVTRSGVRIPLPPPSIQTQFVLISILVAAVLSSLTWTSDQRAFILRSRNLSDHALFPTSLHACSSPAISFGIVGTDVLRNAPITDHASMTTAAQRLCYE